MEKQRISSGKVFEPAPRAFSNAIRFGNLVFTTAKSGTDKHGELASGMEAQTEQALDNIKELLKASGTDLEHVLTTIVYLSTTKGFEKMNKVYSSYFKVPPARSVVLTRGWSPRGRLIEIEAIAGMP
jgi:2-iminobutanoate/2-iminopropanoate deaminase